MHTTIVISIAVAAAAGVSPSNAASPSAAGDAPLRLELATSLVTARSEAAPRPAAARPGDVLAYQVSAINTTDRAVASVAPTLPLPPYTELVPDGARPAIAAASVDGVRFAPVPLVQRVRNAAGVLVDEPVPLAHYRFVRWAAQPLAAGQTARFEARVRITGAAAGTAAASDSAP